MTNIPHVTLNDMTQLAKFFRSTGTKHGHPQKGHDMVDCYSWVFNKEYVTCHITESLSAGRYTDISTTFQNSSARWKCCVKQSSHMENLMCSQRQTNIEPKKDCALLLICLEWTRTKISSKYIILQKPLCQQRNNTHLLSEVKILIPVASPNGNIFHW